MMNGSSACRRGAAERHQRWPIWEAEADVELLSLVPTAASANYDAPLTVERFKLLALAAEASGRELETRHKSIEMLRAYCRDAELFAGNAAAGLL